jgi:hypothetical protein
MADRSTDGSTNPWVPIEDYTPEALQACEKALRTVVSRIGAWGPRLVLFGGLAPRYIVDSPPSEVGEHTGTTDLDVVVGVEIEVDDEEGVYTKLQQELRKTGFDVSAEGSYAWERRVDGVRVVLEFFCPVEQGGRPGRLKRNPGGEAGSSISAIQLRGAEMAGADCCTVDLSGEILDHGGRREVTIRVVNILPFLVLKAFALETRDKEKDAYDIVWTLNAYGEEGPASAAEAAAGSPIADSAEVAAALDILQHRFSDPESQGPSNYARFFLGAGGDDDERMRLRMHARGTIRAFLARWHAIRKE